MNKSERQEQQNNFLYDFIKEEMYLQEPPMEMVDFINFCNSLGVKTSKKELEYFEKEKLLFPIIRIERPVVEQEMIKFKNVDEKEYSRPAKYGLQKNEIEVERYKDKFYSYYGFSEHESDLLLNWAEEGNLFDPATKEFQSLNNFLCEEIEHDKKKIVSFYSRFQIYHLEALNKSFSITLNLIGDEISVSSLTLLFNNRQGPAYYTLPKIDDFADRLKEVAKINYLDEYFDLKKKKEKLKEDCKNFDKFLKFMLSVQSVYSPYIKSGGGTIEVTTSHNNKDWHIIKQHFDLDLVLKKNDIKIEDICKWYWLFSDKAQNLLGVERDDWIQLWKNIAWSKKDKLEGNTRLGVEYLQWAVMLKRILTDHLQKEILDIDEMLNISADNILDFEPDQMKQYGILLRASRNEKYSDAKKNYYYDRYKRLFYLANDFGLDYQPRVIVFVEGKTEETIFPEIFERFNSYKPENIGVEFISIEGISQFFGQKIAIKDTDNKYQKVFISNFNHLVSYNLNKWQIIPFFIGDDENNITSLLKKEISISFNQNQYPFPKDWQYIWGFVNENKPFRGKDFEMSNFTNEEIATVLKLYIQVTAQQVEENRNADKGIKQINSEVEIPKIEIARTLYQNLFDKYEKEGDESVFERPVFKVIDKITDLAVLNHPPTNRISEIENKDYFEEKLKKYLFSSSATPGFAGLQPAEPGE